jgi:hypothetical protein
MIRTASAAGRPRSALVAFAAMASVYFFSYVQRTAIPGTIFDELQVDFSLAAASVAALGALLPGSTAVCRSSSASLSTDGEEGGT